MTFRFTRGAAAILWLITGACTLRGADAPNLVVVGVTAGTTIRATAVDTKAPVSVPTTRLTSNSKFAHGSVTLEPGAYTLNLNHRPTLLDSTMDFEVGPGKATLVRGPHFFDEEKGCRGPAGLASRAYDLTLDVEPICGRVQFKDYPLETRYRVWPQGVDQKNTPPRLKGTFIEGEKSSHKEFFLMPGQWVMRVWHEESGLDELMELLVESGAIMSFPGSLAPDPRPQDLEESLPPEGLPPEDE